MKNILIVTFLSAGLLFCQEAAEKAFSGNISLSAVNRYLWRGKILHDNPALQPGVEGTWKDLTLGFWGSVNLGEGEAKGFGEADFYLSYDRAMPMNEKLAFSAAYNLYTYPVWYDLQDEEYDHEFSLSFSADVPATPYLSYSIAPSNEFDGLQWQYFELGGTHDIEVKENFSVGIGASAGYGLAEGEAGFSVLGLSVSPAYRTVVDINPVIFYQVPLGKDYDSDFYIGLTVAYNFEL